ncbi:DUF4221 family protein [Algoriphagus aestuariicola]|uniref:DUF4221 family protein n=1 Tax=Algoriphagus aestuariicola TaxID=1852016 RepID=A0ABS3BSN5_9BACT|nr:DUF4221 family protein [Algoriphagus aestuariicola]MBN7802318.1 DUF4221 family protein [Algoriphagus aestuariicola]
MKNLLLIFLALALFSCSAKEENADTNMLENLSYTVDTVMVDAVEDFLNLSNGIRPYGLTEDKRQLWFFESAPRLVQVDLDQAKVLKKSAFEEEGPDGVGSYITDLEIGPQGELYLKSERTVGVFGQNAKTLQNLKFVPSGIDSSLAQNRHALFDKSVYDFGSGKIYSHPSFSEAGEYVLLILDPETQSATSLPVPKMKIVDDFSRTESVETKNGTTTSFYAVGSNITLLLGEVILSTPAMSGFYRLDIQTEKLEFIDIQHKNYPNSMDIAIIQNPSEASQMFEIQKKIWKQINYQELMWDDSRQLYFRVGMKTKMPEQPGPPAIEFFLFAYDRDFNVVGETKLEGENLSIWDGFFKDGKLWSYVNVDDELGFALIDFDF